uniref:Ig-like domain-containing protein n=1 Tax=Pygocentrus nattereri TaxID=42514 RepID=A0A3B4BNV2_PYGNA
MFSASLLLLLLAAVSSTGVYSVELTQSGPTIVRPGQSMSLTCKVSGYLLTDGRYCTGWIRQPAGKALEWIGVICANGYTSHSNELNSRFEVTRDTSSNTVFLRGQNLQTGDTAVYYCAREQHTVRHISRNPVQKLLLGTDHHCKGLQA